MQPDKLKEPNILLQMFVSLCNQDVWSLYFDMESDCTKIFLWFSSVPTDSSLDSAFKMHHDHFRSFQIYQSS